MDPFNTPRSAESGEASKQDSWLNKDRHTKAVTPGAQTITREMGLSGCHSMSREDKSQLTKFRDLRSAILFCKRSRSVNEHSARLHGLTTTHINLSKKPSYDSSRGHADFSAERRDRILHTVNTAVVYFGSLLYRIADAEKPTTCLPTAFA
jgi:hypothetical protein